MKYKIKPKDDFEKQQNKLDTLECNFIITVSLYVM